MAEEQHYDGDYYAPGQLGPVETLRHSTAHLLAAAVVQLYPGAKMGFGPCIEHGFYYDFDLPAPISNDDLPKIEEKMREIAKGNLRFERSFKNKDEAVAWARENGQDYKAEHIGRLPSDQISFYSMGSAFTDLCNGPHVNYSSKLKHFKLTHTAGAYWLGDEKRPMLTRIYGVAFDSKEALEEHLRLVEEAKKRDHRKLGKELELFMITPEYGGGLVLWLPNGAFIRKQIEDFWRAEHLRRGYELVFTPHIAPRSLWVRSRHVFNYADSMFAPMEVEGQPYQLKPMNCPFHMGVYNLRQRSYRELPLRLAELGTVYRFERSGALHGLMRVRGFTQDDAHIFCTDETFEREIDGCLDIAQTMYATFGFPKYKVELSCRDPKNTDKFLGDDALWQWAEGTLAKVLERRGIDFRRVEGEAAFYGPKIDIKVVDAIGREWQLTTVQLDWNNPDLFDLNFVGTDNQPHRPIMVHRALLGSMERFFGILIEHYAGNFPAWLAPVQAKVLPLSEKFVDYAEQVAQKLRDAGLRPVVDRSDEKLGYKVRRAELERVPYALVVGGREAETGSVGVRKRMEGDLGSMPLSDFIARLEEEVRTRAGVQAHP
jgi:threonyl-tRNA synthetase